MDISIDGETCSAKYIKGVIKKLRVPDTMKKTRINIVYNSILCDLCVLCGLKTLWLKKIASHNFRSAKNGTYRTS